MNRRHPDPVERVRWRRGNAWRYGHLGDGPPARDGSVRVWDSYTGGARSLPVTALQQETRGPRGGRRWDWLVPRPAPVVTAVCAVHPAWKPPEGLAEMFNQGDLFDEVDRIVLSVADFLDRLLPPDHVDTLDPPEAHYFSLPRDRR